MELAENFCAKGQQVMLNRLRGWMVRFVVHGVCDLRYSVFVDRTKYDFEGKYNKPEKLSFGFFISPRGIDAGGGGA
jgi:hypothetical protein